jgi:hypothetical protein
MTTAHVTPEPIIDDDFDEKDEDFIEEGDWTEERHGILENLSMEEIAAEILHGQAANPERYLTPEELQKKIFQTQETPMPTGRHAKMVEA